VDHLCRLHQIRGISKISSSVAQAGERRAGRLHHARRQGIRVVPGVPRAQRALVARVDRGGAAGARVSVETIKIVEAMRAEKRERMTIGLKFF